MRHRERSTNNRYILLVIYGVIVLVLLGGYFYFRRGIFAGLNSRAITVIESIFTFMLLFVIGLAWFYHIKLRNIYRELFKKVKEMHEIDEINTFTISPDSININRLRDGLYININEGFTELTGYTREDVIGKTSLALSIWDNPADRDLLVAQLLQNGSVDNLEAAFRLKNGEVKTGLMSARVLMINGDPHIISVTRDITERKQMEAKIKQLNIELEQRVIQRTAQLEASNKELEAFAYSISHDLRAPLRAIEGFSRILEEDYGRTLDNEGKRLLNVIRTNTKSMDQLITDLLALSRVNRIKMNFSDIDMNQLSQSIYHEVASAGVQKEFIFTVNSPLPRAYGDSILLRQVWTNLISNAIKYTLPKPVKKIEVGGFSDNQYNIYYIKDSGVGFNPDYTHKLFGAFQRLHRTEEFEGTGVGLAIVQRIIHRHGGYIRAEGKVNEGAVFYFSIPHSQAEESFQGESCKGESQDGVV